MKKMNHALFALIGLLPLYALANDTNTPICRQLLTKAAPSTTLSLDNNGIPNIHSASDKQAFMALGCIQAEHRLWQINFQRHLASGTLSTLLGKAALSQDQQLQRWQFRRAALKDWGYIRTSTDPMLIDTKKAILSYTAGVNLYIRYFNQLPHDSTQRPLLFRKLGITTLTPWQPVDSLSWEKMLAFNLDSSWQQKILHATLAQQYGADQVSVILPPYPANGPTVLNANDLPNVRNNPLPLDHTPSPTTNQTFINFDRVIKQFAQLENRIGFYNTPGKGSNNWVVSGTKMQGGKPSLANDPHLDAQMPSIWYLAHLQSPTFNVTGATLLGLPAVIIGHNDHIGWGVTSSYVNNQDVYLVSHSHEKCRASKIIIRNADPVTIQLCETTGYHSPQRNGLPIIATANNQYDLAIRWTALTPDQSTTPSSSQPLYDMTFASFLAIDRAQNWSEFEHALQYYTAAPQNFVYADTQGNVGYYLPGYIPIRNNIDCDTQYPFNEAQSCDWPGSIPFAKLPHVFNPKRGYIASANNKIAPDTYPYPLTFRWPNPPYRAEAIDTYLKNHNDLTQANMQQLQLSVDSLFWQDIKPYLTVTYFVHPSALAAYRALQSWGTVTTPAHFDISSYQATLFATWFNHIANALVPKPVLEGGDFDPLFIINQLKTNGRYCQTTTPNTYQSCQDLLNKTFTDTIFQLQAQFKTNDIKQWTWGTVHPAKFLQLGIGQAPNLGEPWNRSIAAPGNLYTVNVAAYPPVLGNNQTSHQLEFVDQHIPSYRQILDFGNLKQSGFIIPTGQINRLTAIDKPSPHFNDLTIKWRDGDYLAISE